ncbi:MAG: isochorismatase family protein [Anaerosomatales bacterium]|nr:isochorismatase family protein [Anaerosomatales bacterium]
MNSAYSPALGRISRSETVLVVIDVQERLAAAMPRRVETAAAVRALARGARVLDVPVIATRQYPKGIGEIVAEISEALAGQPVVDKLAFDCMAEPAFVVALRTAGRSRPVLCGMEAHICVTQTALSMVDQGLRPVVVADAVCSRRDVDREVALARLRQHGVEVATVEQVLYEMVGQAGTEEFKRVLEVVKERDACV